VGGALKGNLISSGFYAKRRRKQMVIVIVFCAFDCSFPFVEKIETLTFYFVLPVVEIQLRLLTVYYCLDAELVSALACVALNSGCLRPAFLTGRATFIYITNVLPAMYAFKFYGITQPRLRLLKKSSRAWVVIYSLCMQRTIQ
jgi:hypothetical protein